MKKRKKTIITAKSLPCAATAFLVTIKPSSGKTYIDPSLLKKKRR